MRRILIAISAGLVPDRMVETLLAIVVRQAEANSPAPGSWAEREGDGGPAGQEAGPSRFFA